MPDPMTDDRKVRLLELAEAVAKATGPDERLTRAAHMALGWSLRRVTGLGLNGRTPGYYRWFEPNSAWDAKGRPYLPSVSGPRVRKRIEAALRAQAAKLDAAG